MEIQYILFIVFVGVAVVVAKFLGGKGGAKPKEEWLPYMKKSYLLTPSEHKFFSILEKATENKYYIFPQIVLTYIVQLKGKGSLKGGYRSKIDKKTVDFVLFDKKKISTVLVIELDDPTHQKPRRQKRDSFVNKVLDHCGIPILHVLSIPNEEELRIKIQEKIAI